MNMRRASWAWVAGLFACATASAQMPAPEPVDPIAADVAAARFAEIDRERSRLQAARTAEEAACYQRFAVTGCLDEVRLRYRPPVAELRRQEVAVRSGERRRQEIERQARMDAQQQAEAADRAAASARAAGAPSQAERESASQQRQADRAAAQPAQAERARLQREQAAQERADEAAARARLAAEAPAERARFEQKQQAAQERRDAQARRAAERSGKPPSAPLPAAP